MAKVAKKTEKKAVAAGPVAIPTAIRETAKPGKPGNRFRGLAAKLAGLGKKESRKSGVKDKDRSGFVITEESQAQFKRVAPAKVLLDYIESYLKTERAQLDKLLRDEFLATMWKSRTKPQNPKLVLNGDDGKPDATALFSLVSKWHIEDVKPKRNEGPEEAFIRILVDTAGLKESKAEDFVHTELDFTPQIIINLTALEASEEEVDREAAKKLSDYLAGDIDHPDLDDDEKSALITVKASVKVLDGFLDRLCGYCTSLEQVDTILTSLIRPEWHLKNVKYGVSDPEDLRTKRLLEECRAIIKGAEDDDE